MLFVKIYLILALLADAVIVGLKSYSGFGIADFIIPIILYIGIYLGLIVLHIVITLIMSLFIDPDNPCEKPNRFCKFWVDKTIELLFTTGGLRIKVNGIEKIPTDRRFLLVSNHRSNLDPMVCMMKLSRYNIAFISKPENFRIPIAGRFISRCCFMPIDRENARNAMRTIHKATDYIKNDIVSVGVYPEGTRSKTGELLEFKDGVFYIAKKAPCPIVVITVRNTEKAHKNFPFKPTKIIINVVDVIEPEDFAELSTHEISDKVRVMIFEDLSGGVSE